MSSFTEEIILKPAKSKNRRILVFKFHYCVGYEWSDEVITVPAWYEFDWASIPRLLWTLVGHPMDTMVIRAALVHDYMYTNMKYQGRKKADDTFLEAMLVSGVRKSKAIIYWLWVRLWGWYVYYF